MINSPTISEGGPVSLQQSERLLGKSLPATLEAERAVLGAVMLNDELLTRVAEILVPTDFYYPANQYIFSALLTIVAQQKRIDILTVKEELSKKNLLEKVGGTVYLVELQEQITAQALVDQHALLIKEKSILRDLIMSATAIIGGCYNQNDRDIDTILDEAEKLIFTIGSKRVSQNFVQLTVWLKKTFQHLADIKSNTRGVTGVPSGYSKLDEHTSGWQGGDLIVLAARPSMGKTSLALDLALHASRTGATVGIFSLEMAAEQLTLRLLSSESGISHQHVRNGTISAEEWVELTRAAGLLAQHKLFIDDTAMLTVMDLRTKARTLKREHGLQLLIIDYLQLLHTTRRHENRHQEVSDISRSLKALAKELSVPVIALSQLSRAVDSRLDKRPLLSDLRESGAIEQDADVIMFLYRDSVYNPEAENPAHTELIIGKQRNGPTGTVHLNFVRELTRFDEWTGPISS